MVKEVPLATGSSSERSGQSAQRAKTFSPVVELRQYTLYPGQRDVLIDLFDREFVESQEAVGIKVIGQFRDLDHPDLFVWLRGFEDMPGRARALQAFYGGPAWEAHRDVANATMVDFSNVLLLRPAYPTSGFSLDGRDRPPRGRTDVPKGLVVATICHFAAPVEAEFLDFFEHALKPLLTDAGASILACFVTETSANNFPRLPVREGENVFVWFSLFSDRAAYEHHAAALARSERWPGGASGELARRLEGPPEVWKLSPTGRSQLHG
jgi:hypothetical protein